MLNDLSLITRMGVGKLRIFQSLDKIGHDAIIHHLYDSQLLVQEDFVCANVGTVLPLGDLSHGRALVHLFCGTILSHCGQGRGLFQEEQLKG